MRNWHPGPLLFHLYSDTMTYQYTSALLLAIQKIKQSSNPEEEFPSKTNLEKINLVNSKSFSTYDLVNSNFLLIDKKSVEYLNEALV